MNREVNINNNKKRLKLYYGLLTAVMCVIGVSFAWFRLYLSQSEDNIMATKTCFSTTLTENTSEIKLTDAFPVKDTEGLKQDAFTFTLKNNCSGYVKIYITINSKYRLNNDTNYLKDENIKVNISSKDKLDNSSVILSSQKLIDIDNDEQGYFIIETGLNSNEEKSYDLRVWMDGDTTIEQGLNKSWAGKVVVVTTASYQPLAEAILANNTISEPLTVPGKSVSLENEAVLATAEDDYGKSYYFRGNVQNNYVEFANMCWRIVRITGDGSIKLVLYNYNANASSSPCNDEQSSDTAAFARYEEGQYLSSFNSVVDDSAYVGFMYGTVGSSDWTSSHANKNKSVILLNLESWYKKNLISYEDKLSDVIWCNDKGTFSAFSNGALCSSNTDVCFNSYNRLYGGNKELYAIPSFICPNDNNDGKISKFTVDDTINGNGDLTYKIGLLTADEVTFAGFRAFDNYEANNYLVANANYWWWTMSPRVFGGDNEKRARVWDVSSNDGRLLGNPVNGSYGLRPSIALVPEIKVLKGTGTSDDPYIVN